MRPKGTPEELERRRRRAVELVERGESPTQVVRILGVQTSSVHRWRRLARRPHDLDTRPASGPTPGLSNYHLKKLERLLAQGARKHGWPNELWTTARVARLIRERFGRPYHPEHARKFLKQRLGWTSQKPQRKPRERDNKEVERWLADALPHILREAWKRRAHLVFLDEPGFQLMPSVRRTLAPRGRTPVLDITPGPGVNTAGFIGHLVAGPVGAVLAGAAVFLPCYLMVLILAPFYRQVMKSRQIKAFVSGVTVAATGAISGAVFVLGRRALVDVPTVLIGAVTLGAILSTKKVPEPVVIRAAGVGGVVLQASGLA